VPRSVSVFMIVSACLRNAATAISVAYRVHPSITIFWTIVSRSTGYEVLGDDLTAKPALNLLRPAR
jgi:hypothetical protein